MVEQGASDGAVVDEEERGHDVADRFVERFVGEGDGDGHQRRDCRQQLVAVVVEGQVGRAEVDGGEERGQELGLGEGEGQGG